MEKDKVRITFRMEKETNDLIKEIYQKDGCQSVNEFINKATKFYLSSVMLWYYGSYFNPALLGAVKETLKNSEKEIAEIRDILMSDQALIMNLVYETVDIDCQEIARIRGKCIDDVKAVKGRYD